MIIVRFQFARCELRTNGIDPFCPNPHDRASIPRRARTGPLSEARHSHLPNGAQWPRGSSDASLQWSQAKSLCDPNVDRLNADAAHFGDLTACQDERPFSPACASIRIAGIATLWRRAHATIDSAYLPPNFSAQVQVAPLRCHYSILLQCYRILTRTLAGGSPSLPTLRPKETFESLG